MHILRWCEKDRMRNRFPFKLFNYLIYVYFISLYLFIFLALLISTSSGTWRHKHQYHQSFNEKSAKNRKKTWRREKTSRIPHFPHSIPIKYQSLRVFVCILFILSHVIFFWSIFFFYSLCCGCRICCGCQETLYFTL